MLFCSIVGGANTRPAIVTASPYLFYSVNPLLRTVEIPALHGWRACLSLAWCHLFAAHKTIFRLIQWCVRHLGERVPLMQGEGCSVGLGRGGVGPCVVGRGCHLLAGVSKRRAASVLGLG